MANVEVAIQRIAHQFVQEIVKALVGASIEEFAQLAYSKKGGRKPAAVSAASASSSAKVPAKRGRPSNAEKAARAAKAGKAEKGAAKKAAPKPRNRRSSEEIEVLQTKVISFIQNSTETHPEGVSVSEIAKSIKADIEDITRPIHHAITQNLIRKTGEKRLTRYFPTGKLTNLCTRPPPFFRGPAPQGRSALLPQKSPRARRPARARSPRRYPICSSHPRANDRSTTAQAGCCASSPRAARSPRI